jgi:hypothetical protein
MVVDGGEQKTPALMLPSRRRSLSDSESHGSPTSRSLPRSPVPELEQEPPDSRDDDESLSSDRASSSLFDEYVLLSLRDGDDDYPAGGDDEDDDDDEDDGDDDGDYDYDLNDPIPRLDAVARIDAIPTIRKAKSNQPTVRERGSTTGGHSNSSRQTMKRSSGSELHDAAHNSTRRTAVPGLALEEPRAVLRSYDSSPSCDSSPSSLSGSPPIISSINNSANAPRISASKSSITFNVCVLSNNRVLLANCRLTLMTHRL